MIYSHFKLQGVTCCKQRYSSKPCVEGALHFRTAVMLLWLRFCKFDQLKCIFPPQILMKNVRKRMIGMWICLDTMTVVWLTTHILNAKYGLLVSYLGSFISTRKSLGMRLMASPTPKMLVVSTGSTTIQDENSFKSSQNFFLLGGGGVEENS